MGAYSFLDVKASIIGPGGSFNIGSGARSFWNKASLLY